MAAILDFKEVYFYSFIVFLTHENMGLDTKIESLTCLVFALQHIYQFSIMSACMVAILDF